MFNFFIAIYSLAAIIYNSGYALITVGENFSYIFVPLAMYNVYYLILKKRIIRHKITLSSFIFLLMILMIFLSIVINNNMGLYAPYFRFLMVIVNAYAITFRYTISQFWEKFKFLFITISVISLIAYLFFVLLNVTCFLPKVINNNGVMYYNGLIYFAMINDMERNIGVFWEPGIFASFIVIMLLLDPIVEKKIDKKFSLLMLVTLFTTKSTAGILLIPLIFIVIISEFKVNNLKKTLNYLIVSIVSIFFIGYTDIIGNIFNSNSQLFGKIVNKSGSVVTRMNGPVLDLKIFLFSPLLGNGYYKYFNYWSTMSHEYNLLARTSTLTFFPAVYGISGFLYFYAVANGVYKLRYINKFVNLLVLLVFIFILSKEPHQNNMLMFILIFYMLNENCIKKGKYD